MCLEFKLFRITISCICCRSRILVEEEGEIFRKGIVLLGPAEMEGDYAGEELRREVRPERGCNSVSLLFSFFFFTVARSHGRKATTASINK